MECYICCLPYNKSNRKEVKCLFCDYSCCRLCYSTYLLDIPTAKCMNCNKDHSLDFIYEVSYKKFYNTYLEYRAELQYQKEKSLLPLTLSNMENDEYYQLEIEEKRLMKRLAEIRKRKRYLDNYDDVKEHKQKVYIRPCSNSDCNGYLTDDWTCGLCEYKTCSSCFTIKDNEHKCLEGDIETAKMIKKNTKSCPNCFTPIFKIDGCDQMYCVVCHTAFSWKTLQIEKGKIHNPEYFKYLRDNNLQNVLDRDYNEVKNQCYDIGYCQVKSIVKTNKINFPNLDNCYRLNGHIREISIPRYINNINDNDDIRREFLLKEITEFRFKELIKQRIKKREKHDEMNNVLTMFCDMLTILFNNLPISKSYIEFDNLRKYTNDKIKDINKKYKSNLPLIDEIWNI
jgi:hypothetical protein